MRRLTLLAIAVLALTGCAGRNFVRPQADSLVVGQTTDQELRQRFGDPYREGTKLVNGETVKTLAYAYATGGGSLVGGLVPARGQTFYVWNGVLVGHDFTSSFDEDKTDFDTSKAQSIRKGETTEAGVVSLFGKPHGVYRFPLVKGTGERGVVYLYSQVRGSAFNLKFYEQRLVVTLADGVVRDVELTASGER